MTAACKTCRFWQAEPDTRSPMDEDWMFGQCRRQPPRLIEAYVAARMPRPEFGQQIDPEMDTIDLSVCSLCPATFITDWCGEWQERAVDQHAAWLERRNSLRDAVNTAPDQAAAAALMDQFIEVDNLIFATPATTAEGLLAKLVCITQTGSEGFEVSEAMHDAILAEAISIVGMGRKVSKGAEGATAAGDAA